MRARGLEHELFGADAVKRDLQQRVAAHRRDGKDHAAAKRLMADLIAGIELQKRR